MSNYHLASIRMITRGLLKTDVGKDAENLSIISGNITTMEAQWGKYKGTSES